MNNARFASITIVVASLGSAAHFAQGSVFPDRLLPIASGVRRVAPADVNGDGKLDLVAITNGVDPSQVVSVRLGLGAGQYQAPQGYGMSGDTQDGAVGDLNLDGRTDVVVTRDDETYVGVFLSTPAGTLSGPVLNWSAKYLFCAALADFNGDGFPDIAAGSEDQGGFSVMYGNGSATFSGPSVVPAPLAPFGIDAGDLDLDGDVDVVGCGYPSKVVVLLNSVGFLSAGPSVEIGGSPYTVDFADLDQDGTPEFVAGGFGSGVTIGTYVGGGFTLQFVGTGAGDARYTAVGDANGDGFVDVVASVHTSAQTGELAVLLGDGTGALASPVLYPADNSGIPLLAHLDGDFVVDLAAPSGSGLRILPGIGGGSFLAEPAPEFLAPGYGNTKSVISGDLDGDGWLDLVAAHYGVGTGGGVSVQLSVGPASYAAPTSLASAGYPFWAGLADFDADGALDVVVAIEAGGPEMNNLALRHGDGLGGFGPQVLFPTNVFPNNGAIADLDLDGRPDVATTNYGGSLDSSVSVLRNDGAGGFQPAVHYSVPWQASTVEVAELSGDIWPDLAVGPGGGKLTVLTNQGGGTFAAGPAPTVAMNGFRLVDVDADGIEDLLATLGSFPSNGKVEIRKGDGLGGFQLLATLVPTIKVAFDAVAADFDADGRIDVASSAFGLSLFRGTGIGTFGGEELHASVAGARNMTAADLDHDGRLDLVACADASGAAGGLALHLNRFEQPLGAIPFAIGSPSCGGIQIAGASVAPAVGQGAFAITSTNAPPLAHGFLLLGTSGSYLGVDPFGLGLVMHVNPLGSFFGFFGAKSSAVGTLHAPLAIPPDAGLGGAVLFAQTLWIEPIGPGCSGSFLPLSTSSGLQITIAP